MYSVLSVITYISVTNGTSRKRSPPWIIKTDSWGVLRVFFNCVHKYTELAIPGSNPRQFLNKLLY